jgi:membrane associated rhomboid family serine protease/ribosomal protein L37AE/L43A
LGGTPKGQWFNLDYGCSFLIDIGRRLVYSCPTCKQTLEKKQSDFGIFWVCETCKSRLVTLAILRRTVEPSFFNGLWRELRGAEKAESFACPLCSHAMNQLQRGGAPDPQLFRACQACGVVWMGPAERAALPLQTTPEPFKPPPEPPKEQLPSEAQKLLALHEVELIAERRRRQDQFDASHLPFWQKFLAALGFPIEDDPNAQYSFPWFTVIVTLITTAFSIRCFFFTDFIRTVDNLGFIPDQFGRYSGATFLTSFFVHGGWMHLIGNMYFLFVFGRCVEDKIGAPGIFLLLLSATLGSCLFTLFFQPGSDIPHIGASGGVAGVLLFYGFAFPNKKLVFSMAVYMLSVYLVRLPAFAVLALWVMAQIFGAFFEKAGMSTVSYSGHLGGLLTGLVFWLLWRWHKSGGLIKVESK